MKNELIITDDVTESSLLWLISCCRDFLQQEIGHKVELIETKDGYDLEYDGIEIGSYGIRSCEYLKWIYGTGIAEPRLTMINNIKNI